MPNIVLTKLKGQDYDKDVKSKIMTFLMKLADDDTSAGLHIEKMNHAADKRARTARVDLSLRAVLYRMDVPGEPERTYVYAGTWEHDTANKRAMNQILRNNPINGVPELIDATVPEVAPQPASEFIAVEEAVAPTSFLADNGYLLNDLTEELGFDSADAERIFAATTADQLLTMSDSFENQWQSTAIIGLAVVDAVSKIRTDLGFDDAAIASDSDDEDARLVKSFQLPAAKMQFAFVEDDEELRRVIEGGDFGAWRVFLHPEQRAYADKDYNGPFRLTGGAGTGKTVVLLHRAKRLADAEPASRTILTTFTKALSEALGRDLERLDPTIPRASSLGGAGVLVRGIDQLAVAVREKGGADFWKAARHVFGEDTEPRPNFEAGDDAWEKVFDLVPDLPDALRNTAFFAGEYLQVILPHRITTAQDYFKVRRPGRGVALDRRKRANVWKVIELYRQTGRQEGRISFAELSAVAASYLNEHADGRVADHVLVDEAQDLTPLHWQLLRALVGEHKNDLFIAEDTHQRIYGQHVVLSRYGIKITGRSRRLTLNYRTTQQNLNYALGILAGGLYLDSEEAPEVDHGYRSSRTGPAPRSLPATNVAEQYDAVAEEIKKWSDDPDIRASTIAILTRTNKQAAEVRGQLADRGVVVKESHTGETAGEKPLVLTMHKSKGLEFSRVVLFDISHGSIPAGWMLKGVAEEEIEDVLLRERSLLYVAASRARDEVVVSWQGQPSELLGGIKETGETV
ncbi:UvrD-helicase domain-containing protein [Salinibacterium sp. SWN248]|uniref:UvrD-helicase domain-containing protein n=1 Tax=Salinibacterium sp. SWN248 TaxID=2792056 RepID=UPI0018CF17EE|nr:UvrD-helicase domain-containing protein [Salinibacterium sp. SWN248]MBH0022655.1 UvrD-helicase domain-containing protein [Salinibacterium sp. SWN248]